MTVLDPDSHKCPRTIMISSPAYLTLSTDFSQQPIHLFKSEKDMVWLVLILLDVDCILSGYPTDILPQTMFLEGTSSKRLSHETAMKIHHILPTKVNSMTHLLKGGSVSRSDPGKIFRCMSGRT
ncbi:hypothetical protein ElyMa_005812200 [Elysia marginata]|uniref:Uncharacterized protein n=1 Tax=Elysia marginata TaxID=1093978 RepID=A0AAV4FW42_9GAST|nr:hypothetical protein ElyMa_005812200 [Elysia marginata]